MNLKFIHFNVTPLLLFLFSWKALIGMLFLSCLRLGSVIKILICLLLKGKRNHRIYANIGQGQSESC